MPCLAMGWTCVPCARAQRGEQCLLRVVHCRVIRTAVSLLQPVVRVPLHPSCQLLPPPHALPADSVEVLFTPGLWVPLVRRFLSGCAARPHVLQLLWPPCLPSPFLAPS